MIEHLVFLKLKPHVSNDAELKIIEGLKKLPETIKEIKELSVGKNFSSRNKGFQIGLRVFFENKINLEKYIEHPDHVSVLNEFIKPVLEDIIVVDYEF